MASRQSTPSSSGRSADPRPAASGPSSARPEAGAPASESTGTPLRTRPGASDARLRGRTYAISFDRVWTAALGLATETPRWSVLRADDQEGAIYAEATGAFLRRITDVTVRIGLDANAQTRVDLEARPRKSGADLGTNVRRIGRFFQRLDQRLDDAAGQILDPAT